MHTTVLLFTALDLIALSAWHRIQWRASSERGGCWADSTTQSARPPNSWSALPSGSLRRQLQQLDPSRLAPSHRRCLIARTSLGLTTTILFLWPCPRGKVGAAVWLVSYHPLPVALSKGEGRGRCLSATILFLWPCPRGKVGAAVCQLPSSSCGPVAVWLVSYHPLPVALSMGEGRGRCLTCQLPSSSCGPVQGGR